MAIKRIQSTFSGGIHSPKLNSSVHLDQYYTGLKKANNVMITPQGTIKRRYGTNLVETIQKSNDTRFKFVEFSITSEEKYILLFGDKNLLIFTKDSIKSFTFGYDDAFNFREPEFNFTNSLFIEDFCENNFGGVDPNEMDFAQSLNTLIITHKSFKPKILTFSEDLTSGMNVINDRVVIVEDLQFKNMPKFDFEDEKSPINKDFQAKFSIQRAESQDGTDNEVSTNRLRISLDGEITNWIDVGEPSMRVKNNRTGVGYNFNWAISTSYIINLDNITDKEVKVNLIDRKSNYKSSINRVPFIKTNDPEYRTGKLIQKGNVNFRGFNINGNSIEDFIREFSVDLNILYFYEMYGIVLDHGFLLDIYDNSSNYVLPIRLLIGSSSSPLQQEIKDKYGQNSYGVKMAFSSNSSGSDILRDIEEFTYQDKDGNTVNNEENEVYFAAHGDYYFIDDSNIIEKVSIVPESYNTIIVSVDDFSDNNRVNLKKSGNYRDAYFDYIAPSDLYFKIKKEIQDLNIIKDMSNVYVNNGIYGLFMPTFGGNCPINSSPDLRNNRTGYIEYGVQSNGNLSEYRQLIRGSIYTNHRDVKFAKLLGVDEENDEIYDANLRSVISSVNIKIKGRDARQFNFDVDVGDGNENLTEVDIANISTTRGGNEEEDAWSDLRGWPSKCLFIENRLVFANTKLLPNAMWFSEQSEFFSFKEGGENFRAINNVRPTQSTLNPIYHIIGNKSLQVFTSNTEHYNPNAISASELSLPEQANYGTFENIKPVFIDNTTFYLDKNYNLRAFYYDDLEQGYQSNNVSIISPELINNSSAQTRVINMRAARIEDSNYIFLIMQDGSMVVYQSVREQNISNFVVWNNPSVRFLDLLETDSNVYLVARFNNKNTLLKLNNKAISDLENEIVVNTVEFTHTLRNKLIKEVAEQYEGFNVVLKNRISNDFIYINEKFNMEEYGELYPLVTEDFNFYSSTPVDPEFEVILPEDFTANYFNTPQSSNFTQIGIYFSTYIETKDIAYDIGRGQELVGMKKFNKAYISLNNSGAWYLTKNNFQYKPRGYILESDIEEAQRFNIFNDDTEIRLTGYHNRVNIKLEQVVPSLGDLQLITLEIKV